MSIEIKIKDGKGKKNSAAVDSCGRLLTIDSNVPIFDAEQNATIFSQFLTCDGLSTGCEDMTVDGSCINVEFIIPQCNWIIRRSCEDCKPFSPD